MSLAYQTSFHLLKCFHSSSPTTSQAGPFILTLQVFFSLSFYLFVDHLSWFALPLDLELVYQASALSFCFLSSTTPVHNINIFAMADGRAYTSNFWPAK